MKICWDNLEKLEYRYDRNAWQDKKWKHVFYIYKDSCKNCGEPFLAQEGRKRRFCDHSCATSGEYHPFYGKYGKNAPFYGKKHSKKTIRKMRVAKIGENHPFYDKKLSKEHREKLSETKIGENNPNWKGGISCEPYCDVWLDKHFKESIKERDGYK